MNKCKNQQIKPFHFIQCWNNFMFLCIMDDDTKEMVTTLLPALTRCPQNVTEYLRQLLKFLLLMIRPHPDPLLNIRHRMSNGQIENWDGCDALSDFLSHRYSFYLATGETPESLLRLTRTTRHLFLNETGRNYTILPVNRVMLYMMWLRFYPSYYNLALIFNVSLATVHNEINECITITKRAL